jgi:hypothetical protein
VNGSFSVDRDLNISTVVVMFTSNMEAGVEAEAETAAAGDVAGEVTRLAGDIETATHKLLACIRRFEASEVWLEQGAGSCAHWLAWRIGWDLVTAWEKVRVARALGRLPAIDAALAVGELSYAKVRALTRVATRDNERRLLDVAREATASELEQVCRRLRSGSVETAGNRSGEDRRGVRARPTATGLVRVEATLQENEAMLVMEAIERARGDGPRADGLVRLASGDGAAPVTSAETPRL